MPHVEKVLLTAVVFKMPLVSYFNPMYERLLLTPVGSSLRLPAVNRLESLRKWPEVLILCTEFDLLLKYSFLVEKNRCSPLPSTPLIYSATLCLVDMMPFYSSPPTLSVDCEKTWPAKGPLPSVVLLSVVEPPKPGTVSTLIVPSVF